MRRGARREQKSKPHATDEIGAHQTIRRRFVVVATGAARTCPEREGHIVEFLSKKLLFSRVDFAIASA
jgi:hypothetical protein